MASFLILRGFFMRVYHALSISDHFDFALSTPSFRCSILIDQILNKSAFACFQAASYLTDPVCKGRELCQRTRVVDALNPTADFLSNLARKVYLCIGMIGWISLAVVTTLPGIALRALGSYLQKNPFISITGEAPAKALPPDHVFSLLSWNICGVTAGYSISDGGVLPWAFRIDEIIDKIIEKDADVNCLYEVFDVQTATAVCKRLKQSGYHDFYFHIGPKIIGVSSGILIASKYKIKNPEFTQFPQDSLVGRTKYAAKGVFAFDLASQDENFAKIFSTHLQHSEEPQFPTPEEIEARKKQMQIIVDKVNVVRDRCIVVTGDLNLDDDEYRTSSWQACFQKGDRYGPQDKTWGGNEFIAKMDGQRSSSPLNLDHTMIVAGTARAINTTLVNTGFDAKRFQEKALSDHAGLLSRIAI
jgi:endonuclease/exonuclease/phosphatase family metal-dependent hydrolase